MSVHHLIVGGQRSGKSRHAERLALAWLSGGAQRRVSVVATALAADEEMRARIARHQADRPANFDTCEAPLHLSSALQVLDDAQRLIVVDCLTLWATNWLFPAAGQPDRDAWRAEQAACLSVLVRARSPIVLVSNEVGWGVVPLSAEVRHFVDELGWLNQGVARQCGRVTLMVAGQPWTRPVEA